MEPRTSVCVPLFTVDARLGTGAVGRAVGVTVGRSGFRSGGGGGVSGSRPVAAISIGPEGVCVQPVVDVTKIALAFLTAFGAMFMMFGRMKRASRELVGD